MADEKTPALELAKTILVDGQDFNVNAKAAEHVENPLTIYKSNLNKKATELLKFDGSAPKSIDIVPANGGSFAGRITVPPVSNSTLKADGETVLNYNDIVGKVVDKLLHTSAMATWSNNELSFADKELPAIHGICVVVGTEIDLLGKNATEADPVSVVGFARCNYDNKITATSENPPVPAPKWVPNYLYICEDTGNIYLGGADSVEVTILGQKATDGKDITPQSIQIGSTHLITLPPANPADYATYGESGLDMHNSDLVNINSMWFADKADSPGEGIIFINNTTASGEFHIDTVGVKPDADPPQLAPEAVIGDRLFAVDGELHFRPREIYYNPPSGEKNHLTDEDLLDADIVRYNDGNGEYSRRKSFKVYHSGSDLSGASVGHATYANQAGYAESAKTATSADTATTANTVKVTYKASTSAAAVSKQAKITISPNSPSGGNDGDIWIKFN